METVLGEIHMYVVPFVTHVDYGWFRLERGTLVAGATNPHVLLVLGQVKFTRGQEKVNVTCPCWLVTLYTF